MFSDSLFGKPILAIESSCDETSAAVVVGQRVLSNVIASQAEMHEKWGGVVPEAAARAHVQSVIPVIDEALSKSGLSLEDIGGIAVTNRPGLIGALSVGVTVAKALALGLGVQPVFPMVSLLVSGGHSELVLIRGCGDYELLGQTRDDAAGEAFDKGARLLGLGYPGGRQIQEHAKLGTPNRYSLPRGLAKERYEMSFSGLKTAVLRLVEQEGNAISVPDAAASLQQAVCDALLRRLEHAIEDYQPASLGLCGGVAANSQLRSMVEQLGEQNGIAVMIPPFELCTDNAAMIGLAAQCHPIEDWEVGFELEPSPRSLLFSDQG